MSLLCYNGVSLPYMTTTAFSQEAEYDESDTDLMVTKFDITVQGVLNTAYINSIDPTMGTDSSVNNPAAINNWIRSKLLAPRRYLSFKVNDTEMIPRVLSQRGTTDSLNGPRPKLCNIIWLTNSTFLIQYRIVAKYWEAIKRDNTAIPPTVNSGDANGILSHRWTEVVEVDQFELSTWHRSGKFTIRSDNPDGFIAQRYLDTMCNVGVPRFMLRKKQRYEVSPDGLSITYQIVDEEPWKMPPGDALEADGDYNEVHVSNGAQRIGEIRVVLRAGKQRSQESLVTRAVAIAASKIVLRGGQTVQPDGERPQFGIVDHAVVRTSLYRNEVECRLRVRMQQLSSSFRDAPMAVFGFGQCLTPFTDGVAPSDRFYDIGGTRRTAFWAAAHWDPSLQHNIHDRATWQFGQGREVGTTGTRPEFYPAPE